MNVAAQPTGMQSWKLLIHGGAGLIERSSMKPDKEQEIRAALDHALDRGAQVLETGGSSLDAVEAAVTQLEDNPHFNAGRGAVITYEGTVELDAAIMNGSTRAAGAVASVTTTTHPVSLARKVMEKCEHVFLSGEGADQWARAEGLEQMPNDWFATAERQRQLDELKARSGSAFDVDLKYGTVGAVALDTAGHVAAGTSTGGLTGKRWGRIGDSPVIGAGIYADDASAAVAATGTGEYFMRAVAAHQLAERLRLAGQSLQQALDEVLRDVTQLGGSGGLIALAPNGETAWGFTTPGMYRGLAAANVRKVALYADEDAR